MRWNLMPIHSGFGGDTPSWVDGAALKAAGLGSEGTVGVEGGGRDDGEGGGERKM